MHICNLNVQGIMAKNKKIEVEEKEILDSSCKCNFFIYKFREKIFRIIII